MSSSSSDDSHPNISSSLVASCRKLVSIESPPPVETISIGSVTNPSVDSGRRKSHKVKIKAANKGVAKACRMLAEQQAGEDKKKERGFKGVDYFMNAPSKDDELGPDISNEVASVVTNGQPSSGVLVIEDNVVETDTERSIGVNGMSKKEPETETNNANTDRMQNEEKRDNKVKFKMSSIPHDAEWDPMASDDEENDENAAPKNDFNTKKRERLSSIRRRLSRDYDEENQYIDLPASTHTLLHTEPIFSIPFLFSLGVAVLSAMCLILVLVSEFKQGQDGNLLGVPTGISPSVRAAQYCGIFVGLLMEEEIPQGLILLRSVSRASFHESYPDLSYERFVLSCLLRLVMGYLFLMNLFVTIVQADDVITIFFDILALEFVQHLDDMAYELGRKDILGRELNIAANVEYKVLTKMALKHMTSNEKDEENALIEQPHQDSNDEDEWRFFCFRRHKKKHRFGWILKATYFINTAILIVGTIIVGAYQKKGTYRCQSVTVTFGDPVWENAYVTNDTTQETEERTLVYSYFNGVYRITGSAGGYPVYTEMNKISAKPYQNRVGAEIVYCENEEAWVFRHQDISKREATARDEDQCQSWLFRSPKTNVYDLTNAPRDDWSVWTGIITPTNEVSIVCNECSHDSDCNYNGVCREDGDCVCNDGFFGLHCQYEDVCPELIDDKGEIYSLAKNSKNETLFSYNRPIYRSKSFDFLKFFFGLIDEALQEEKLQNDTFSNIFDVLAAEEISTSNVSNTTSVVSPSNTCYPFAKKIRLESNTGEQIAISEFQSYTPSGFNVALYENATQSSDQFNGEVLDASKAVDGNLGSFSHTNDDNPTWEVVFDQVYFINNIVIVNHYCGNSTDKDPLGCLCHLSNATLLLFNEEDTVVASENLGNTCGQQTVSLNFAPKYSCQASLSINSTGVDDYTGNSTQDALNLTFGSILDEVDTILWGAIALVYSGSRWFGTIEFGSVEKFDFEKAAYGDEYHAFWDMLYEGKTILVSDPTMDATPVGADFYTTEADTPWEDYGPFGLLKPMHNISGKGFFHCLGTNLTAVKVSSGTGIFGFG